MTERSTRPGFLKTNRLQLVRALYANRDKLPEYATTDEWCDIAERAFRAMGLDVYCHRSAQVTLRDHAARNGEMRRFEACMSLSTKLLFL